MDVVGYNSEMIKVTREQAANVCADSPRRVPRPSLHNGSGAVARG